MGQFIYVVIFPHVKIYLSPGGRANRNNLITKILENLGHEIIAFSTALGEKSFLNDFRKLRDSILASDAVIAHEKGNFEPSLRYELALALDKNKPALIVTPTDDAVTMDKNLPEDLQVKTYDDDVELEIILDDFTSETDKNLGAKLFMNIPAEMDRYLSWIAAHTSKTKSETVREAVLNAAQKDKDYQKLFDNLS